MQVLETGWAQWEKPEATAKRLKAAPAAAVHPRSLDRFAFLTADGQTATPLEQEALLGDDDLVEASFLDRCFLVRNCIGRIRFQTPRGRSYATGFLIAPGIVLTNHHVFKEADLARGASIEFGYWYDVAGQLPSTSNEYDFDPNRFFVADKDLDFAAVAVAPSSTIGEQVRTRRFLRLIAQTGKAEFGEFVTIIQHPDGEPMRIALRENKITRLNADEPFLHYAADTAHGSSGAPVFNDSLQLVALHSSGRIKRDPEGRYALKNGSFVSSLEGIGEKDVIWETNVGFRISRIAPALIDGARSGFAALVPELEAAMQGGDVLGSTVAIVKDSSAQPAPAEEEMTDPIATKAARAVLKSSAGGELVVPLELRVSLRMGNAAQGAAIGQVSTGQTELEAEALPMRIPIIYDNLEERDGFDPGFLGLAGSAPMPELTAAGRQVAAPLLDGSGIELKYGHFSVWMHKGRRLALFTASNVDWRQRPKLVEGKSTSRKALAGFPEEPDYAEQWVSDPRIDADHQLPDIFYTEDRGAFDKGHLVRRDDVCWGGGYSEIQMSNGDTYHVTNCSPQIKPFNQGQHGEENWGDLESHIQKATKKDQEKAIIYAGPIFGPDDRWFRGKEDGGRVRVQIPSRYWKIVLVKGDSGPEAYGFILDQDVTQITEEEFYVTDEWKGAWRPIRDIQDQLRGWINLSDLIAHDQHSAAQG